MFVLSSCVEHKEGVEDQVRDLWQRAGDDHVQSWCVLQVQPPGERVHWRAAVRPRERNPRVEGEWDGVWYRISPIAIVSIIQCHCQSQPQSL